MREIRSVCTDLCLQLERQRCLGRTVLLKEIDETLLSVVLCSVHKLLSYSAIP